MSTFSSLSNNNSLSSDQPSSDEPAVDRLFSSEPHYMPPPDYITRFRARPIDLAARQDSINWILKVHSHYQFKPQTAILSINYFDRFVSDHFLLGNGWQFQLLSVACLSLAAKMEETQVPLILDLEIFLPNFIFEPKTVQRMELLVLANLNWKLLSVTPFDFLHYFTSKLHSGNLQPSSLAHLLSMATELILKTTRAIEFLNYTPSITAAAAVISAVGDSADLPATFYERVNKETVRSCHQLMMEYMVDTCLESRHPVSPAGVLDSAACISCYTRSSQAEPPPNKRIRLSDSDLEEQEHQP